MPAHRDDEYTKPPAATSIGDLPVPVVRDDGLPGWPLDLYIGVRVETRRGVPYVMGRVTGRCGLDAWWVQPVGGERKVKVATADLRAFVQ